MNTTGFLVTWIVSERHLWPDGWAAENRSGTTRTICWQARQVTLAPLTDYATAAAILVALVHE
jgi:hypothetical protein